MVKGLILSFGNEPLHFDRDELQQIYNNKNFWISFSSPFNLSTKSYSGVKDKWKAYLPCCLASTSILWPGNCTPECILAFLALLQMLLFSLEAMLATLLIFDVCVYKKKSLFVFQFFKLVASHFNRLEVSPSFVSYKQLVLEGSITSFSVWYFLDGLRLGGCNMGWNNKPFISFKRTFPCSM